MKSREELPLVSVVMPVHNAAKYLREAAESILKQTYTRLEFIIVDDGSTDESVSIIRSLNDPRIFLHSYKEKQGISKALNKGFELAKGELIARMDADDISLDNRLEQQVNYMMANPGVGILGTQIIAIGSKARSLPVTHKDITWHLFNACPFLHPSVMFRKSVVLDHRLFYDPLYDGAEDLELWVRAAQVTRLANLDKAYVKYRYHFGTHQAMIATVANLNTDIRLKHIDRLLPGLTHHTKNNLALFMNRHIKHDRTLLWLQNGLDSFETTLAQYPDHFNELAKEFNKCLWFHFSSDPGFYKEVKKLLKNHTWFRLSLKQQIWLMIKPLLNGGIKPSSRVSVRV